MFSQSARSLITPPEAAAAGGTRTGLWSPFPMLALALLPIAALAPAPVAVLLVFAPVAEELVFRGGLQETLLRRLNGRFAAGALIANVLTALAFAAAHVALNPGVLAVLTVLPALCVGWVYQQQRRLAPCIALHALFNATWLLCAGTSV